VLSFPARDETGVASFGLRLVSFTHRISGWMLRSYAMSSLLASRVGNFITVVACFTKHLKPKPDLANMHQDTQGMHVRQQTPILT
jgi:hypothetical protein